ncbi:MAG: hypothetical protein K0R51_2227 [Cytophagaceae bacterium]|nr:hypothetical protein [Cytophagaceae bacterium]
MRRLRNGLLLLLFALVVLSIIGLALPPTFKVSRTVRINNSAAGIYPYLNTIERWPEWTILNKSKDATILYSFSGPERGIGGTMTFDGEKLGNGKIIILDSERDHSLNFELKLNEEQVSIHGVILLVPKSSGTDVTITLEGNVGFHLVNRYIILMTNHFYGPMIEETLQNLQTLSE